MKLYKFVFRIEETVNDKTTIVVPENQVFIIFNPEAEAQYVSKTLISEFRFKIIQTAMLSVAKYIKQALS